MSTSAPVRMPVRVTLPPANTSPASKSAAEGASLTWVMVMVTLPGSTLTESVASVPTYWKEASPLKSAVGVKVKAPVVASRAVTVPLVSLPSTMLKVKASPSASSPSRVPVDVVSSAMVSDKSSTFGPTFSRMLTVPWEVAVAVPVPSSTVYL